MKYKHVFLAGRIVALVATGLIVSASSALPSLASLSCQQARRGVLPRIRITENDLGRIRSASYWKTSLPRPDGRTAVVLQGIRSTVSTPAGAYGLNQRLAFVEDSRCWSERQRAATGAFECYKVDIGTGEFPHVIANDDTRLLLSALTYLATGGANETASTSSRTAPSDGEIYELTSAPAEPSAWYICQTCGDSAKKLQIVDPATIRFAVIRGATIFILPSPARRIAYLAPNSHRIEWMNCR